MSPLLSGTPDVSMTLDEVEHLADRYGVPVQDALLIGINLHGISSCVPRHRARVQIRLSSAPRFGWQLIVPLNAVESPFRLDEAGLVLGGEPVGRVERIDADDAVGGYFRDGGRAATLNPNARSRCVGCAFCPNTLEAAADPRLSEERDLRELLVALREQHPRRDLTELREVTVSTGCFERESAAVDHLMALRTVLTEQSVEARIGLLTSVITTAEAFARLEDVAPFVIRLTAECFARRDLLLKASKAALGIADMPKVLRSAVAAGHGTSFTYIAGLDGLDDMRAGISALAAYTNEVLPVTFS